jgi:hypothetical protein
MTRAIRGFACAWIVLAPGLARAQDPPTSPPSAPAQPAARPTGLPKAITWTFNFDAGWGTFGFANSLFDNPKEPGVNEQLSDQWFEGHIKPGLSGVFRFTSTSELFGAISGVGERTYGSVPADFGEDVSSFQVEDLSIGWRSGTSIEKIGEHGLEVVVGRTPYPLGHGFLLFDGAAEGGSRGGYWTNARKAFAFAAVARLRPGPHLIETFYLDRDELPEADSDSRTWGTNYELTLGDETTVGATYMRWFARPVLGRKRDGMHVVNVRAYTAPIAAVPDLSFEFEYASERNGDRLASNAWTLQASYAFSEVSWAPTLTYRYAFFQGDDPATTRSEAFDPLFPGFYDWGTWWQGEIAGEYFLANSNLVSHLVRAHVDPTDNVGGGLLFFKFLADQPASIGPDVTDRDLAVEIDAYVDWKLNDNVTTSFLAAFGDPGRAVQQSTGRTKPFAYGMVYVAYRF